MIFVKSNFYIKIPYIEVCFDFEDDEEKNFLNENYNRIMDKSVEIYTGGRYVSLDKLFSENPSINILNFDSDTSSELEKWINKEFESYQLQKACDRITLTVELKL